MSAIDDRGGSSVSFVDPRRKGHTILLRAASHTRELPMTFLEVACFDLTHPCPACSRRLNAEDLALCAMLSLHTLWPPISRSGRPIERRAVALRVLIQRACSGVLVAVRGWHGIW